ncbi:MAG: hypothetical protein Roseis2KO_35230 [Roseivirga sp.]
MNDKGSVEGISSILRLESYKPDTIKYPFKVFQTELSFKLVDFGSYYILADGLGDQFPSYLDSLEALPDETLSEIEGDVLFLKYVLRDFKMIDLPYFNVKIDSQVYVVYCDSVVHDKIKEFKRATLQKENQTVKIDFIGRYITERIPQLPNILLIRDLLYVQKISGQVSWRN